MPSSTARSAAIAFVLVAALTAATRAQAPAPSPVGAPFHVIEATIDGIEAERRAGRLTCTALVKAYLDRIAAYDQKGPTLNAVQNVNPNAMKIAAEMDQRFQATGTLAGPLDCIPVLVKDEVNTNFMPTTYGSAIFKTLVPPRSGTIVTRLQAAGAIILAKTNMGEFAQAYSGSAFGDCHNAYDPGRSPSGSSCGTGAGIAANFATVGIGEDTGGSIRGPAAHESLVGLRPTLPLVSRAGMMPFAPTRDTLGPITRTVRDTAIVLDVVAGYDADDPVTAWSYGQRPATYTASLVPNGLMGMRFGVIRTPMAPDTDVKAKDYAQVQAAVTRAVSDLVARGAVVIDPVEVPMLREMIKAGGSGSSSYEGEAAINAFLAQYPDAPARTLREIVDSPLVLAKRRDDLRGALGKSIEDAG
jgi:amidase